MAIRVLTTQQLRRECGSERAMRDALARAAWTRVLHGAYAGPDLDEVDLRVRSRAAALVLPPGTVVAGHSVLWLCGVDVLPPGAHVLEVVVDRGRPVPRRAGVRAREGALADGDVGRVGEVPALRPARATVDLLRRLALPDGVAVADAVQHAGLCDRPRLDAEIVAHVGLRDVCRARQALALSDPLAESPPESRLRVQFVLAGLHPVAQYDVHDAAGTWVARVDLGFPAYRVAVEYDGRAVHSTPEAFVRDRQRQNALLAAGWRVLRFSAYDLRLRSDTVLAEVQQALRSAP